MPKETKDKDQKKIDLEAYKKLVKEKNKQVNTHNIIHK